MQLHRKMTCYGYIISELLADREFGGEQWFKWLSEKKTPFTIRIRKTTLVNSAKGNERHVRRLFINLKSGQVRHLLKQKAIFGLPLWLAATRAKGGEWVIVATTHKPEEALSRYKKRWNIEPLFGFLKSKGFNFEDTHITHPQRLHNLLSVLTLSFCFAYKTGQILTKELPLKNKKHARPERSVLRVGLDFLREVFFKIERSVDNFTGNVGSIFRENWIVRLVFSGG